jgi:Kef-type K+ transport system membrane component KefB
MPVQSLAVAVLFSLAVITLVGTLLGVLARHWGQPAVIGEIAAGISLGPSVLGLLPGDLVDRLFPQPTRPVLISIANVVVVLFMFSLGWKFDFRLLARRRTTLAVVSSSSALLPLVLGAALALLLHVRHGQVDGHPVPLAAFVLFIGVSMAITALPVLGRILADRGMADSPIGAMALACAAVCDVAAWCLLAVVVAMAGDANGHGWLALLGVLAGYVVVLVAVVRPLMAWLLARWPMHLRVPFAGLAFAGALLSASATEFAGVHAVFGAFAFGLVMPRARVDEPGHEITHDAQQSLAQLSMLLLPAFFVGTGLAVDLGSLDAGDALELVLVVVVACVGKLAGAALPAALSGWSWRSAGTLGVLMNTRGLTELIVLNVGLSAGLLERRLFTVLVIVALVTTAMTGPLLSRYAAGGRDGPDAELLSGVGVGTGVGAASADHSGRGEWRR